MLKIQLTKLGEVITFNNAEREGIRPIGKINIGMEMQKPTVGNKYFLSPCGSHSGIYTTEVTEVIDENTFRTKNSIYKREILEHLIKPNTQN